MSCGCGAFVDGRAPAVRGGAAVAGPGVDGAAVDGAAVDDPAVDGPAVDGAAVEEPGVTGLTVADPAVEGAAKGVDGVGVAGGVSVEGDALRGPAGAAPRCCRPSASIRDARSSTRVVSSVNDVVSPSSRRLSASI